MKDKNTQNAVVPTKDTRQYKHTPKTPKRLTSKIFALVALVLMFSTFALNVSATGWQYGNSSTAIQHPYAPSSFSYINGATTLEYSTARTFPLGDRVNTPSNNAMSIDGVYVSSNVTVYGNSTIDPDGGDGYTIHTMYGVNTSQFPQNTVTRLRLAWSPFAYTTSSNFSDYFNDDLVALYYNSDAYYYGTLYVHYYDPTTDTYGEIEEEFYVTEPARHWSLSYILRGGLQRYLPTHDVVVMSMLVDVIPTDTPNVTTPSTSCRLSQFDITARALDNNTPTDTLISSVTRYQQVVNEGSFSNLFDYLGSAIGGFMDTPVLVIGNLNVTLAMIFGASISLLLIFAFLRFFSGG